MKLMIVFALFLLCAVTRIDAVEDGEKVGISFKKNKAPVHYVVKLIDERKVATSGFEVELKTTMSQRMSMRFVGERKSGLLFEVKYGDAVAKLKGPFGEVELKSDSTFDPDDANPMELSLYIVAENSFVLAGRVFRFFLREDGTVVAREWKSDRPKNSSDPRIVKLGELPDVVAGQMAEYFDPLPREPKAQGDSWKTTTRHDLDGAQCSARNLHTLHKVTDEVLEVRFRSRVDLDLSTLSKKSEGESEGTDAIRKAARTLCAIENGRIKGRAIYSREDGFATKLERIISATYVITPQKGSPIKVKTRGKTTISYVRVDVSDVGS